jgi:hypothetical protein
MLRRRIFRTSIIAAISAAALSPLVMQARPVPVGQASPSLAQSMGLHAVPVGTLHRGVHLDSVTLYHLVNGDGQCLDADSNDWGTNGDNVQLWACNSNGEQSWHE